MSVKPVNSLSNASKHQNFNDRSSDKQPFTGTFNPVVGLMDIIEKGGYPTSFIIQDGLGFIAPRVGKGLYRGREEEKDQNGNPILDKYGNPKYQLNWKLARKEFLREIITGPSAFLIPLGMLTIINKKFGSGHNIKLNYLNSFQAPFTEFAQNNKQDIYNKANKKEFYEAVFKNTIDNTINSQLPDSEKMTGKEIKSLAEKFAKQQIQIEEVSADKSLTKKQRISKINEIGTVEDAFTKLQKNKIGGTLNEFAIKLKSTNGEMKSGNIKEMLKAMKDYFPDAVKNTAKALKKNSASDIASIVEHFTKLRMGSRILTNLGIFGTVAAFYTQIPKLYNLGLRENPALKGTAVKSKENENVSFTGNFSNLVEKSGEKIFNGKKSKFVSDIFELNGPSISGSAMAVLLYGFCIPPRLRNAQDKYDYAEILVRDGTAFTAILFGAKALARLFSDRFTKITGLALNKKDMENRNILQKICDYLNPADTRHTVLSSQQLKVKYTNLEDYKGGINGFIEFIENSGGNIKKAFAQDNRVMQTVNRIVREQNGKSFKESTTAEIKEALKAADKNKTELIKEFYEIFKKENGLLNKAKTCNSAFGFLSTLILVPGLIIWLTDICKKMTERRAAEDFEDISKAKLTSDSKNYILSSKPTMAGFLNK